MPLCNIRSQRTGLNYPHLNPQNGRGGQLLPSLVTLDPSGARAAFDPETENAYNIVQKVKTDEEGREERSAGRYIRHQSAEDSCHSTNRGISTPCLLRVLKSPSTLTGPRTSSSAIFTVCRRIDLSARGCYPPTLVLRGHLRVCACI